MENNEFNVSTAIRMALAKVNSSATKIAEPWGISRAAISNKFYRDSWSADDLVKLCHLIGAELLIRFPDGQEIKVDSDKVE